MEKDKFMEMALKLARRGEGRTSPNPLVGAVVIKGNKVVGRGFHKRAGGPHAEVMAIDEAGLKAGKSDLYVNLEPCVHFGKTPPCTDLIIKRKIKNVFIGMPDPNPLVFGKGAALLRSRGIGVSIGILEDRCRHLNQAYIKFITRGIPYVTLKLAASLDGKISLANPVRRLGKGFKPSASYSFRKSSSSPTLRSWPSNGAKGRATRISNERSRKFVHALRSRVDAVMVGINTILSDDPMLNCRLDSGRKRDPIRVIVDSRLRTPLQANVIRLKSKAKTIIATTPLAPEKRKKRISKEGVDIVVIREKKGRVDIRGLMRKLGRMDITHLLVEGGGELAASVIKEGIVDNVCFFYAPRLFGGRNTVGMIGGEGIADIEDATFLKKVKVRRIGDDILVEGYVNIY